MRKRSANSTGSPDDLDPVVERRTSAPLSPSTNLPVPSLDVVCTSKPLSRVAKLPLHSASEPTRTTGNAETPEGRQP